MIWALVCGVVFAATAGLMIFTDQACADTDTPTPGGGSGRVGFGCRWSGRTG